MRGLPRDPALVPLSRDHHFALVQALALRRVARGDQRAAAGAAREFLAFYVAELAPHIADEEAVLLPASRQVDPEGAVRVLAEHREIEALVARLEQAPTGGDAQATLAELGELLHDHVRFEERGHFMAAQTLPAATLAAVGAELARRRGDRAGTVCERD